MLGGQLGLTESNWTRPQCCRTQFHRRGCQQPMKDQQDVVLTSKGACPGTRGFFCFFSSRWMPWLSGRMDDSLTVNAHVIICQTLISRGTVPGTDLALGGFTKVKETPFLPTLRFPFKGITGKQGPELGAREG